MVFLNEEMGRFFLLMQPGAIFGIRFAFSPTAGKTAAKIGLFS